MFTVEELINKVREIAKANPDFVYQYPCSDMCYYTDVNGGCLFGQAINLLDSNIDLTNFNPTDLCSVNGPSIKTVLRELNIYGNRKQIDWCSLVQGAQDEQVAWGEAVSGGDARYGNI